MAANNIKRPPVARSIHRINSGVFNSRAAERLVRISVNDQSVPIATWMATSRNVQTMGEWPVGINCGRKET